MTQEKTVNKKGRILIIDDQPFMIKLIQYNLKKEGYITITETDGLKAYNEIEKINPDLIILDIRMPKISGTELCRKFRAKDSLKETPILFLTGQIAEKDSPALQNSGATDFMTKPFSPAELIAKVNHYTGK